MPAGRPTLYSSEVVQAICDRLIQGDSLKKICNSDDMPAFSTVCSWLAQGKSEFLDKYRAAREMQAEILADELKDISDEEPTCVIPTKAGGYSAIDKGGVERNKLRVNTRQWIASRLLPKKYGDKVQQEITGENGGPVFFTLNKLGETVSK